MIEEYFPDFFFKIFLSNYMENFQLNKFEIQRTEMKERKVRGLK